MRSPALLALSCVLATACVTTSRPPTPPDKLVSVHGDSDPFPKSGRRTFPHPKAQCFEAVLATFKTTGHGVDKADLESGIAVSGKATVYRAAVPIPGGTVVQRTEHSKLYVRVTGSGSSCDVDVRKLRFWSDTRELENARESWLNAQLHGFMVGVEQELLDAQ
jgi:hypothetical protein